MRLFLFLLVFLMPIISLAQHSSSDLFDHFPPEFSRAELNINGKVSKVTEKRYYVDEGKPVLQKTVIYYFDNAGVLIQRDITDHKRNDHDVFHYSFKDGRIVEVDCKTSVFFSDEFTYTIKGNMVTKMGSDDKEIMVMNSDNKVAESRWFYYKDNPYDKYASRTLYTYWKNGPIREIRKDGGPGSYDIKITMDRDGRGNISVIQELDMKERDTDTTMFEYVYGENSNWIKRTKKSYIHGSNTPSVQIIERTYE